MTSPPIKRRRGCLFYGCLTSSILMLVILAGLMLGYLAIRNGLTDTKPIPLAAGNLHSAEMDQVRHRVDIFRDEIRSGHSPTPLSLTGDELNALIATDPNLQPLKGK